MNKNEKTLEEIKAETAKMQAECEALRRERDALKAKKDRRVKTMGGMHQIAVAIEKDGRSDLTRGELASVIINCELGRDSRVVDSWITAALATELLAAGADLPGGTSRILIKGSRFRHFLDS